ncbi:MAG: DUF2135 domain-containing protein [Verrucomicrobia bacterium]|nr:DUF2135 domain-containing protein [Verrucomicrobiota bacterium]
MTMRLFAALAAVGIATVSAQSRSAARPPTLWIAPEKDLAPIQLTVADVRVQVRGHLAATTIELTFFNPNARVLEGELVFPLGEGQTVSGYALEVEGRMRQAVSVPKEKARVVFEEIVRRGIDPGLAELTAGNVFRARIYPIPARGTKRVALSFEQELSADAQGFRYLLPLGWPTKVGKFHARAEVFRQQSVPVVERGAGGEALTFERWQDGFVAELTRTDYEPARPLAFTVPQIPGAPNSFAVREPRAAERGYFTLRVEPTVPTDLPALQPRRVALFYDASGSAAQRERAREHDVLRRWLQALGNVTVDLIAFRNDADAPVSFEIKGGDSRALLAALEALPLDGGTSLGAIDLAAAPAADFVVLVSDGFSNFGPATPRLGRAVPLFALHAAQQVDRAVLDRLARSQGGRSLDLLTLSTEDALAALRTAPFAFLGAEVVSGRATELTPTLPTPISRGFTLAGRFDGPCEVELSFGQAGRVLSKQRVKIDPAGALPTDEGAFVRRVWAQKRIAELELDAKREEAAIAELGKAHGLVTRFNSLLVLERLEDYVRHRIPPPEPELQDRYFTLLANEPKVDPQQVDAAHLDSLVAQWKQFQAWHAKDHPWLEAVLQRTAATEAGILAPDSTHDRQLVEEAQTLQQRAGKALTALRDKTPGAEREAIQIMLALDVLRKKRGAAVAAKPTAAGARNGSAAGPADARLYAAAPPPRPAASLALQLDAPRRELATEALKADGERSRSAPAQAKRKAEEASAEQPLATSITLKAWNPDTPYLARLRSASDAYSAYLSERSANASSSAFFLDCADFFRDEKKDERLALRILSNLAELELEAAPLLRILAYRLQQLGRYELAVPLFERVLEIRGEEPQSRRDLALCLARRPQPDLERAARLLWEVAARRWDGRFPEIGVIVLHELNALLDAAPAAQRPDPTKLGIDPRCLGGVPVGLRVVLTWDADLTDIDLWVTDPAGETVNYSTNRGATGGHISRDFTQGYGPEVFTIRRPLPGTYVVRANYYGNRQQKLAGATTVQVEFQTAFGRPNGKTEAVTRRLKDKAEVVEVGSFTVGPQ